MIDRQAEGPAPWLEGTGEMGALIRARDWSESALGPIGGWPQSLRTALSICLSSRFPMVIWWGPRLSILYNEAYVPILGHKHPEMLGKDGAEAWSEVWDIIGPMLDAVMERGEATWSDDRMLLIRRYGYSEEAYLTWSYSPIRDESGGVGGVFTAVTETTERVLSARRMKTLRELGAQVSEAKAVESACRAATATLAKNPHDLPFALLYLLGPESDRVDLLATAGIEPGHAAAPSSIALGPEEAWPLSAALRRGDLFVVEDAERRFGDLPGGPWPVPATSAVILPITKAGHARPFGFLVAGISPRRALDDSYQAFYRLAASHVASAIAGASAFEEERKRAEALAEIDRAKTVFFSNISHEFRTPLTLMLGPTEDALASSDRALRGEELETVHRNALRLLRLVNTLLDFSRSEAGRAQARYVPCDLARLTLDLASGFRSMIERAGILFEVDCPPLGEPVFVDPVMWEKIVLNLLSNAFKFTFAGQIRVAMRALDHEVELVVSDTGVGIPREALPRVFERFHRIEGTRSRTHEGSGIGLALVHELVRLHGGSVAVESEVGRGTSFVVEIPRGSAHLPQDRVGGGATIMRASATAAAFVSEASRWGTEGGDEAEHAPAQKDRRILVADDNADMRDYLSRILAAHWSVEVVADGALAWARIQQNPPDLVLTDVMMPNLDGFGLLRVIRSDPTCRSIPVLLLSARAGEEARLDGLEAGADDYLIKPFSARELVARVRTQLELSRLRRSAELERQRLEKQSRELREAHAAAETANETKDEFLAMVGHELRNPLAPIVTALQIMKLRGSGGGAFARERELIERQVGYIVRLVDDLLDISRIARGKLELDMRTVQLATIVSAAVELASPLIQHREHQLSVEVPPTGLGLQGDPHRLAQVVSNLLTNAAKYTDPGGRIEVRAHREGQEIVLSVRDNGRGIERDLLPRVFERFVQGSSPDARQGGGLGLGLAIVKNLVTLHRGTVSAQSAGPGRGSSFTIRLPAHEDSEGAATDEHSANTPPPSCDAFRVLVVDDNRDAADMIADGLRALGYSVMVAYDGSAALEIARRLAPQVGVLDLGLPGMDGFAVGTRLKEMYGAKISLVAVTGYGQDADRNRTRAIGFAEHLVKPVDLKVLADRLAAVRANARS